MLYLIQKLNIFIDLYLQRDEFVHKYTANIWSKNLGAALNVK